MRTSKKRRTAVVLSIAFLVVAGCSSKPKGPPLAIEIVPLGARIDATGFILEDDLLMKNPGAEETGKPGVVRTIDGNLGIRRIDLSPFPPRSGVLTMTRMTINEVWMQENQSLETCIAKAQTRPVTASFLEIEGGTRRETRNGIPVAWWEMQTQYSGSDVVSRNLVMVAAKDKRCIQFEATVNHHWFEKERPRFAKAFESLKPL